MSGLLIMGERSIVLLSAQHTPGMSTSPQEAQMVERKPKSTVVWVWTTPQPARIPAKTAYSSLSISRLLSVSACSKADTHSGSESSSGVGTGVGSGVGGGGGGGLFTCGNGARVGFRVGDSVGSRVGLRVGGHTGSPLTANRTPELILHT